MRGRSPRSERFGSRKLTGLVRASVHYYNTEAEVERCCAALAGLAR